jgi:protein required for attachment to host cells
MKRTGILVAGGTRARFISVEVPADAELDGGPHLLEHDDLVNPDGDIPARVLFSDRSGSGRAQGGAASHGLDDHRTRHQAEIERRFARRVIDTAEEFRGARGVQRLVIVAECQLLGTLRAELDPKRWRDVEVVELAEDLSRQSLRQIHAALAQQGLVKAARTPATGVYRPRGQEPSWR